jgi:transcriptional regulator with GAF, ATPase, and Fis domain
MDLDDTKKARMNLCDQEKCDDNEFFRGATLAICSNLDIEKAMVTCLKFLQNYMPVVRMQLQRFEPALSSIRIFAQATPQEGKKVNHLYPLSEEALVYLKELLNKPELFEEVMIMDDPQNNLIARDMLKTLKIKATSALIMPLKSEHTILGSMVLVSDGKEKLGPVHAKLFHQLKEPFAVAVSNTLKHGEVIQVKDALADDVKYLHEELWRLSGDEIVGAKFGLKNTMSLVRQVSSSDSPILLLGETGTGKDVIANTIHYSSKRREGPFICVNCGAIPENLIDSELFGHEKGAFTGALSQKRGRFERADKGTIFLDEIGELPAHAQIRLLRVLQNREIERVGGDSTIPLDIRIIAATNRDLEEMVKKGTFRKDLWFRLNVFPITIPTLRERTRDIPALVKHFISLKVKNLKLYSIPELAPGAIDLLTEYSWPGNVRELENVVERALILNPEGPLSFEYLVVSPRQAANGSTGKSPTSDNLDDVFANHIKQVLSKTKGRINGPGGAADLLGINPSTLRNRMNKLGIEYGRERPR